MRKAAAALAAAGGGELLFPAGKTVLTAPFNLSSHTTLTVEAGATILCSTRGEDYPLVQVLPWIPFDSPAAPGYWPQPCVFFDGSAEGRYADGGRNITVQGPGTLDGQGKGWWSCVLKDKGLTPPFDARPKRSRPKSGGCATRQSCCTGACLAGGWTRPGRAARRRAPSLWR